MKNSPFDVIVIGAGLGGLLAAAQFAGRGQRVAVVERLAHVGGRFTAKTFAGAQVSTGAVHMLPFGSNGVVAAMLRELHVPHQVHDAEMFGSFLVRGKQIRARSVLAFLRVVGPRQAPQLVRLGVKMLLRGPLPVERDQTFAQWLVLQGVTRATYPEIIAFFERVSHFTLSVDLDQVGYVEVCETLKNMLRYGPPGIVDGGCAAVSRALEARLRADGVALFLNHDVQSICTHDDTTTGVETRDKATGEMFALAAPMIISDIGPSATHMLLGATTIQMAAPSEQATGLKTHVLMNDSFIDHKGIMYCLDTRRIAGVVQPSNSDASLAPPGKHLLITHQLWRPERESIAEARALALADLEALLGPRAAGRWDVLTMSQYHDSWPVNRAAQGDDTIPTTDIKGLYLVGDAVKPSGYLMVEGVAQSVNALLDAVLPASLATHIAPKPPRRRALAWFIAPPLPQRVSSAPPRLES